VKRAGRKAGLFFFYILFSLQGVIGLEKEEDYEE
jgi:hypothetical protein